MQEEIAETQDVEDLIFWYQVRGRYGANFDASSEERCIEVEKILHDAGVPLFELDPSFDRSTYTVSRDDKRVGVEREFPRYAEELQSVFLKFPDILHRRGDVL